MAVQGTGGRRVALAAMTGVLALVEAGMAAIGLLVWNAHRNGNLTTAEAATFILLGASAAIGVVILLLTSVAFARGSQGRGMARLAAGMAWLRLAGVIIALAAVATSFGSAAVVGQFETFGAIIVLADAVVALIVTGIAHRRTRNG